MAAPGVPLGGQLVHDLGNLIVDHVAEAACGFLIRRRLGAGPGRA
jgi:hypothetical protein